jgi:hypothetical protein
MNIYNLKHLFQPPKIKSLKLKNKELQESYLSCSSNKQTLKSNPLNEIDKMI